MSWNGGLNAAVADATPIRSYSCTADETVIADLGNMGGAGSSLTVFGNNYNINGTKLGTPYAGVNVLSGQTLDIQDAGSLDTDKSILTSYNGFHSTSNGGAINNAGPLTVENSVFSTNSTTQSGGVLYNTGNATLTDSTFSANTATTSGGAISRSRHTLTLNL